MIKFRQTAIFLGKNVIIISKRSLFTDRFIHLKGFITLRLNQKLPKSEIEFKHEIQNATIPTLLNSTKLWTLTATSKPGHIELLHQSLNRLHANCSEIQDPQDISQFDELAKMTMRLFDHLELPDKALQFYYEFDNCFLDSATASFILMNLLFKRKRYDDILMVYRIRTINRKRESTSLHKTLVYATCYKLNTPESLQYSIEIYRECTSIEDQRKGRYFIAMLALNQNQLELALTIADDDDLIANNIKLLAMAKLNDWPGVCDLLYKIKTNRLIDGTRYRVFTEVLQQIKQSLDLAKPNLTWQEYQRCHRFIQEFVYLGKLVLRVATMDEILCQPIESKRPIEYLSSKKLKLM